MKRISALQGLERDSAVNEERGQTMLLTKPEAVRFSLTTGQTIRALNAQSSQASWKASRSGTHAPPVDNAAP